MHPRTITLHLCSLQLQLYRHFTLPPSGRLLGNMCKARCCAPQQLHTYNFLQRHIDKQLGITIVRVCHAIMLLQPCKLADQPRAHEALHTGSSPLLMASCSDISHRFAHQGGHKGPTSSQASCIGDRTSCIAQISS